MSNSLFNLLDQQGWCFADGAAGTKLFERGLETGYPPELWSVKRPDGVLRLHGSFLDVGSDLILTNTFGGTSPLHAAAMTAALAGTSKRPFDETAMTAALRTAWAGVKIKSAGGNDRRVWRRRS